MLKEYFALMWVRFLKVSFFITLLYSAMLVAPTIKMFFSKDTRFKQVQMVSYQTFAPDVEIFSIDPKWAMEQREHAEQISLANGNRAADDIWFAISYFPEAQLYLWLKKGIPFTVIGVVALFLELALLVVAATRKSFKIASGDQKEPLPKKARNIKKEFLILLYIALAFCGIFILIS